ncbi:hypothetical protein ABIC65_002863 [Sphingomonas trueperi]|uniref:hypothetical protein n=1 Tax=Sphingomonas trueperi TaxID=53317 RepID=UPI003393D5AD
MIEFETIAEMIPLPATPEGWFDYGYTALADGRLALIRTRKDVHSEFRRWREAAQGGWGSPKHPQVWDDQMRLSIFDGTTESDVAILPSGAYPVVDRMSDGRWLIAGSRAKEGEKNGVIYSADGEKEWAMVLGDGIETLFCAPDATIWVGYFDEGVFGGPKKDGSWPVSSGGLVQFDASGRVLWAFNEKYGEERGIDDIYAMTLCGDEVWACYYSNFPIVKVSGGKAAFWSNGVAGAKAVAVKNDLVMLGGGYNDRLDRITLVKLEGNSSRELGSLRHSKMTRGKAGLFQGRGSVMHLVSDGVWFKASVYKAAAAITQGSSF